MAGADESPYHALDKRVSVTETRLDYHDSEIRNINTSLTMIAGKVDENTRSNAESAARLERGLAEHERRENALAQKRHEEQRRDAAATKRWIISTLVSVVCVAGGWYLRSKGFI